MAAYPFLKPNFFLFSPDNILTCTQNRFNFEDFGKKDDSAILDDSKKELRNIIKNLVQFYHRNDKNIALDDRLIIYFNGNLCFVQPKSVCYNHVDYDSIIFKIGGVFRLFLELPPHSIYQMINQKPLICGFISVTYWHENTRNSFKEEPAKGLGPPFHDSIRKHSLVFIKTT
ncbi:hypothetical protein RF11_11467 [Thelohanellus kitauei]|uniref:Uncharacterized protein n=1 Tax=Thelohanellus kitauei TaxID=669202 RepID=A0A0C2N6F3_THEKT|nr:hypothetical protein RF11_11467 [Thelohanellus kitauei]